VIWTTYKPYRTHTNWEIESVFIPEQSVNSAFFCPSVGGHPFSSLTDYIAIYCWGTLPNSNTTPFWNPRSTISITLKTFLGNTSPIKTQFDRPRQCVNQQLPSWSWPSHSLLPHRHSFAFLANLPWLLSALIPLSALVRSRGMFILSWEAMALGTSTFHWDASSWLVSIEGSEKVPANDPTNSLDRFEMDYASTQLST